MSTPKFQVCAIGRIAYKECLAKCYSSLSDSVALWALRQVQSPCNLVSARPEGHPAVKLLSWICHVGTCHIALSWQVTLWAPGAPVASPSNLLPEAGSICPCLCLLIDEAQQTCGAARCCRGRACCQASPACPSPYHFLHLLCSLSPEQPSRGRGHLWNGFCL